MRNRLIFTAIFMFCLSSYGYTQTAMVDRLLKETKVLDGTPEFIGSLIKQEMASKPAAPQSMEQLIQDEIDYKSYFASLRQLYSMAYSESEMEELIQVFKSGDIALYKEKSSAVKEDLYRIGADFGRESMRIIQMKLAPY